MMIGQLASRTGLAVRTLRFYADAGLLPVAERTSAGYRLFAPDAVARARMIRTLRELGVGLDDIKRVLEANASIGEVASEHARAIDARIATLRMQRAALTALARSSDPEELEAMSDLTNLGADERRRIVEDYLDAVFGDRREGVAETISMGAPELPDDPTPEQLAAWVELVGLLRDPDFVASSRRMAERALAEGPEPDVAQFETGKAVGELAGPAYRSGLDPASPEALEILQRLEALAPSGAGDRLAAAERIEAFSDRRVGRYWTLVGVVNGWQRDEAPEDVVEAWLWYAQALRAHAAAPPDAIG